MLRWHSWGEDLYLTLRTPALGTEPQMCTHMHAHLGVRVQWMDGVRPNSVLNSQISSPNSYLPILNSHISILNFRLQIPKSQMPALSSQFTSLNSLSPTRNFQLPLLNSEFPILNSRFPDRNSQLPILKFQIPISNLPRRPPNNVARKDGVF